MRTRFAPAAVIALAAGGFLTGCAGPAPVSVPADDIATTAENALEEQVGSRPDIDCGTKPIPLVKGKVIPCILTDPVSGDRLDAPITLEKVDGADYTIGIQVGDEPLKD